MSLDQVMKFLKLLVIVLLLPVGFVAGCIDEKARHDATKLLYKAIGEAQEKRTAERIKNDKAFTAERNREHEAKLSRLNSDLSAAKRELRRARADRRIVPTVSNASSSCNGKSSDRPTITFDQRELDRRVEAALDAAETRSEERLRRILAFVSGFETCAIWAIENYQREAR